MSRVIKNIQPYWYVSTFTNLLHATTQNNTLQIQSDADFEVQKIMGVASQFINTPSSAGGIDVLMGAKYPGVLINITNSNSGEKWSNEPVSINAMFGIAEEPMVLPQTKLLSRNPVLLIDAQNITATLDFAAVNIVLFGRKLYT